MLFDAELLDCVQMTPDPIERLTFLTESKLRKRAACAQVSILVRELARTQGTNWWMISSPVLSVIRQMLLMFEKAAMGLVSGRLGHICCAGKWPAAWLAANSL